MSYGRFTLVLASFVFVGFTNTAAFAQSKSPSKSQAKANNSVSLFEARSNIESLISQRLAATISTSLDKNNFEIGVSVELIEAPKKNISLASPVREKPAPQIDFAAGLINSDTLIENYEQQLEELRTRQSLMIQNIIKESSSSENYLVRSMNIHVGLTDSLGEPYKEEFGSWLKKTVEKNYGSLATSEVSFIKSAPKSENKNLLDYISELQGLIGAILVSLFVVIAIILAKVMGSKDAKEQRKLAAQLQQQMQMREDERFQQQKIEEPREVFEEVPAALPEPIKQLGQFEVDLLHGLHTKVMKTAQESGDKVQEVLKSWLESGERGLFKIACLVDVTISTKDPKITPISEINWQEIVPVNSRKRMKEVFKQMADLSFEEKIKILDEVYWDLVSLKTLGSKSMLEPFQFISSLPTKERKAVLSSQNSKTQTLAVLYLPDEAREEYIKDLPLEGKRTLLEETLLMEDILTTDVEAASETLKFVVDRMESGKETISIRSMYPKLLGSFSTADEITLLRDISRRISDDGLSIKSSYPTLAFVDEWPEEKGRFVFDTANADEVLTLLRVIPESKDKILNLCPPRVQSIVAGDFDKQDKSDAATKEKHLSSLRAKFLKAINKQKIDLEAVFPAQNGAKGGLRAA